MKLSTQLFRFLGIVAITATGFLVGGLAGCEISGCLVSDVTERLPPPRDATFPMIWMGGLIGAVVGALLVQFAMALVAKIRRDRQERT